MRPSVIEVHAVAPLNVDILVQRRNSDSDVVCGSKVVVVLVMEIYIRRPGNMRIVLLSIYRPPQAAPPAAGVKRPLKKLTVQIWTKPDEVCHARFVIAVDK